MQIYGLTYMLQHALKKFMSSESLNPEKDRFEQFLASKKISAQALKSSDGAIYMAWLAEFTGRSEAHFWQRYHFQVNAMRRKLATNSNTNT